MTSEKQTSDAKGGVSQEVMNTLMWQSRRGMLELDFLLEPFTKNIFPTLSAEEQATYIELLSCEDSNLFSWFMGKEKAQSQPLADMVAKVLASNQSSLVAMS